MAKSIVVTRRNFPKSKSASASTPLLRAAIYARKSTDDNDRNPENKSVTRQVDRAKAYAESKGWRVDDEFVFTDDGISGAEFKKRPGLLRMLNALKQFDVVVMSELSRLGREQTQTAHVLAELYGKGRRVFFYLTDEELRFKTAVDKFMVGAVSFGAELEREKASQRARDALERKAANGYNAGGACYGYDNVPVFAKNGHGEQVKSHTDYKINTAQAEAVRAIFRAYAAGHGHTTIAKALNGSREERGPKGQRRRVLRRDLTEIRARYFSKCDTASPKRGKRGTGSWSPSAIREILYRQRYCGRVPFGSTVTDRPDLRIVDEVLWQRVQQRLRDVRSTYIRDGGHWWGRPSAEKYLLSGIGKCSSCGKSIVVIGGSNGNGKNRQNAYYYGCSYFHTRGEAVCDNNHRTRIDWLDDAVLRAVERHLTPEEIALTIQQATKKATQQRKQDPTRPRRLEAESRKLKTELERFGQLVADGEAPQTVKTEMLRREARLAEIEAELRNVQQKHPDADEAEIRKMCGELIGRFKGLLLGEVPLARQALRRLLDGPLADFPGHGGRSENLAL